MAHRNGWLTFGILAVLLMVGPAYAHAELVAAEPGPGAVVDGSPDLIWLEFTEPLRPGSDIVVFGTGFRFVAGVHAAIDLTSPTRLVATLPTLAPDNYTVQWTSISVDGDTRTGSYTFGVRRPTSQLHWLFGLVALATLLLVPWVILFVRRRRGYV